MLGLALASTRHAARWRRDLEWGVEKESTLRPEGDVHEADENRHLDERADDRRERRAAVNTEARDGDRDGELEVVGGGRERERRCLLVVGAHALAHEERDREHHHEVDEQRYGDPQHIEWQLNDRLAL